MPGECIRKLCKIAAAAGVHSQLRDICLKETGATGGTEIPTVQGIRDCTVLVVVMPGCSAVLCCADIFRELFPLHMKLRRLDLSHNISLNLTGQQLLVLVLL